MSLADLSFAAPHPTCLTDALITAAVLTAAIALGIPAALGMTAAGALAVAAWSPAHHRTAGIHFLPAHSLVAGLGFRSAFLHLLVTAARHVCGRLAFAAPLGVLTGT
jgi:hypothetical protein